MMKQTVRAGFTLIEILIVMAIIAALFALLLPGLFNRQKQAQIKDATIKVQQLGGYLEQYNIENRGYPTTEQGLFALIYIPDNAGTPAAQPGIYGAAGTADGMSGNAAAVGPEMLNSPQAGMQMPMNNDPNAMMGGGMQGNMSGTGTGSQPLYNPALYTQLRKRPAPYVDSDKELLDPWGTPYRYDNSLAFNGVNQTGTPRPAIWSAGPDKADNTDDDVRNWDPIEAQQLMTQRQTQGAGQPGGMIDPMTGQPTQAGQVNPMGMPGGDAAGMSPGQPAGMAGPGGLPAMPAGAGGTPGGMQMPSAAPAMPPAMPQQPPVNP